MEKTLDLAQKMLHKKRPTDRRKKLLSTYRKNRNKQTKATTNMTIKHMLARLKQKLSHASLAAHIGIDTRTLGRWLSGQNTPLPIFQRIILNLHNQAFPKKGVN